ncbi:DUF4031 domain-containing protein [Georgenia sp. 311]|uniref:DUF4031 domain-containing protein n=1 Tax=Georgenia sp. 311 TaxID=2585134 RepID=UPI001111F84F|nr:DUF4031 domain-containing protein [Georgenia sp. 311]TNC16900.1 DUF4031 domain-containing protein [Georgenia sp. 311]
MVVLLDRPRWPAHGTLWAHLVSDTSLAELHDFAARCGVPRRAFDLDHYDVPAERHAELLAAGARDVTGHELIRRLRAAGLRVPAVDRPVRRALVARWEDLQPGHPGVGEEVLARWGEPHRVYHSLAHLTAVLDRLDLLAAAGEQVTPEVRLAAWFHDAVHDGASPADEDASAELAARLLAPAVGVARAGEVARLVRLTAGHETAPDDDAGHALCDADLGVLGGSPQEYSAYADQVRDEYRAVPDADFRRGRVAVLHRLLDRPALYRTAAGARLWEAAARRNVAAEITSLRAGR